MKIEIETAPNGYVIRDEGGEILELVAQNDPVDAARDILWLVNEHVGHVGGRWDARRIRVITPPGDHWLPPKRDTCTHPWVELSDYGAEKHWRCPCGAEFGLIATGASLEDELERQGLPRLDAADERPDDGLELP